MKTTRTTCKNNISFLAAQLRGALETGRGCARMIRVVFISCHSCLLFNESYPHLHSRRSTGGGLHPVYTQQGKRLQPYAHPCPQLVELQCLHFVAISVFLSPLIISNRFSPRHTPAPNWEICNIGTGNTSTLATLPPPPGRARTPVAPPPCLHESHGLTSRSHLPHAQNQWQNIGAFLP